MKTPFSSEQDSLPLQMDAEELNDRAAANHTTIGIRCTNGIVVLGYEHDYSSLRAQPIDNPASLGHGMGLAWTGQQQDGQHVLNHVRQRLVERETEYDDVDARTVTSIITKELSNRMQPPSTPLQLSCLVASVNDTGRQTLRTLQASGQVQGWKATALGPDAATARAFLEDEYDPDTTTLGDGLVLAVRTLDTVVDTVNRDATTALFLTDGRHQRPAESQWNAAFEFVN